MVAGRWSLERARGQTDEAAPVSRRGAGTGWVRTNPGGARAGGVTRHEQDGRSHLPGRGRRKNPLPVWSYVREVRVEGGRGARVPEHRRQ